MNDITKQTKQSKECEVCGVVFSRPVDNHNGIWKRRKYCSTKCYKVAKKQLGEQKTNRTCQECSSKLNRWKQSKYCSQACLHASQKGKTLSPETRSKIRFARSKQTNLASGESHGQWKGGVTSLTQAIVNLQKYKFWRKHVYERDDFTCQSCGERGRTLNCDHVVPLSEILVTENIKKVSDIKDGSLLWDLLNGRTLCQPCHRSTDTYGKNVKHILRTLRQRDGIIKSLTN